MDTKFCADGHDLETFVSPETATTMRICRRCPYALILVKNIDRSHNRLMPEITFHWKEMPFEPGADVLPQEEDAQ